ncbi:MAG: tRNA pseudouridine(38-40) synthase TruA [Oscillospiraceae bacterium]|nr:tRNA pseudouridine(38-40) synthase TruA [Oscillospiraceae bacterium]
MASNYLVQISFVGTSYHGSQIQKNAVSVQSVFQDAVCSLLGYLPDMKFCSRTDSGVHARRFYISFFIEHGMDCEEIRNALNARLPADIRVNEIRNVPDDFHARYSAKGKTYEYLIWNSRVMNPFLLDRAYQFSPQIDESEMNRIASVFSGRHDFSSFCSVKSSVDNKVRSVSDISVSRCGEMVKISISADGFLYNMARIIVGALLQTVRGKLCREDLELYLNGKPRDNLLITAPACGLYLTEVYY